jgi:hypothetical protein
MTFLIIYLLVGLTLSAFYFKNNDDAKDEVIISLLLFYPLLLLIEILKIVKVPFLSLFRLCKKYYSYIKKYSVKLKK